MEGGETRGIEQIKCDFGRFWGVRNGKYGQMKPKPGCTSCGRAQGKSLEIARLREPRETQLKRAFSSYFPPVLLLLFLSE